MTWANFPASSRRESARWWVLSTVLLLIAVGCLAIGLRGSPEWLAGPPAAGDRVPAPRTPDGDSSGLTAAEGSASAPAPDGTPPPPAAAPIDPAPARSGRVGLHLSRSTPVGLRIPAIDVDVSLSSLGLNPDRTVEVPTNFEEPGWFRLGPSPGERGSAVILGHVDSNEGPAVFYLMKYLERGDEIEVTLADGAVAHFGVTKVATYPNEHFPAQRVYASHGYSALQLVTCGGEFDIPTDSYQANVVVFTSLESATPPPATGSPLEDSRLG
ncbi:MAG: class F sortase [Nocardioidaceae bacterium]|nr:class F sortase [Nocardioidaceae bacterium]